MITRPRFLKGKKKEKGGEANHLRKGGEKRITPVPQSHNTVGNRRSNGHTIISVIQKGESAWLALIFRRKGGGALGALLWGAVDGLNSFLGGEGFSRHGRGNGLCKPREGKKPRNLTLL